MYSGYIIAPKSVNTLFEISKITDSVGSPIEITESVYNDVVSMFNTNKPIILGGEVKVFAGVSSSYVVFLNRWKENGVYIPSDTEHKTAYVLGTTFELHMGNVESTLHSMHITVTVYQKGESFFALHSVNLFQQG